MNITPRWWSKACLHSKSDGACLPAGGVSSFASSLQGKAARCGLCPHACLITKGSKGYCGVRGFDGERLLSPYLGHFSSLSIDPVEKKPLYHWRKGSMIFSLGSLGCTMRCPFCQNHTIAHPASLSAEHVFPLKKISPEALKDKILELRLDSVAYTYNEPALQAEYILEAAPILKQVGIATALISNGLFSPALLQDIIPAVDAANIDLKAFNSRTYARLGGSLEHVMRTIRSMYVAGVHVEVTTLVVPGISDSPEEFAAQVDWLAGISSTIPLHITRYHPAYKFTNPSTPLILLQQFVAIAEKKLCHVHLGNVPAALCSPCSL